MLLLLGLATGPVLAARTDPTIAISSAEALAGSESVLVRFAGPRLGRYVRQYDYPLYLLVFERNGGRRFVRFELGLGAAAGERAVARDDIDPAEARTLAKAGAPLPGARVTYLGTQRIEAVIPIDALAGEVAVVAFAADPEGFVLSNTVPFTIGVEP